MNPSLIYLILKYFKFKLFKNFSKIRNSFIHKIVIFNEVNVDYKSEKVKQIIRKSEDKISSLEVISDCQFISGSSCSNLHYFIKNDDGTFVLEDDLISYGFRITNILKIQTKYIDDLIFDGDMLCLSNNDGHISIYIRDIISFSFIRKIRAHNDVISSLIQIQNDKEDIICSGSYDKTIVIWKILYDRKLEKICSLEAISKVKSLCNLSNNYFCSGLFDGSINIYSWRVYKCVKIQKLYEHGYSVNAILQLSDSMFCSGSSDIAIIIWKSLNQEQSNQDINIKYVNNQVLEDDNAHAESINSMIKLNEIMFASGSDDFSIIIWVNTCINDIYHKYSVLVNPNNSHVTSLILLDDKTIVSGLEDSSIVIWEFNNYN